MENKDEIEKLLSLEIERKMKLRSVSEDDVSYDELVAMTALNSGIPEWKIREAMRALTVEMAILYKEDKEKFKEVLKSLTGAEGVDIVEDDC